MIRDMVDAPETHPHEPLLCGAASGDEARLFHDIVRRAGELPPGVHRVEFHFGEDSEGAPAVWITLVADDDLRPSKEKLAAIQRYSKDIQSQVFGSDSARWPFVEIVIE